MVSRQPRNAAAADNGGTGHYTTAAAKSYQKEFNQKNAVSAAWELHALR
jgi:hypothetical protein